MPIKRLKYTIAIIINIYLILYMHFFFFFLQIYLFKTYLLWLLIIFFTFIFHVSKTFWVVHGLVICCSWYVVLMFPLSCVWSLICAYSLSLQSRRGTVNSPRLLFGCTFDVTVRRRPCIFHAVIKICRSGLPWHLSVLIWGSGAVTLVNAALSLVADLKDERWHFPPFCKLMQLICLTRTKLGFQIPHDEEIKPLNGFPKAIFIARPWTRVIDLSVRISNRLLTWIYKMLLHCCIDPVEMPFP